MLWAPVGRLIHVVVEKGQNKEKGEESVGYLACGCAGMKPVRAASCRQRGIVLMSLSDAWTCASFRNNTGLQVYPALFFFPLIITFQPSGWPA